MEKQLVVGRTYAVTTSSTCDVTDANGTLITSAAAGQQVVFVAPTTTVSFSDDAASVVAVFKLALAKTRLFEQLGGGRLPAGYLPALFLGLNGNSVTYSGSFDKTYGARIDCVQNGSQNANNCQIITDNHTEEKYWYVFPARRGSGSLTAFSGYWFYSSFSFKGTATERAVTTVNFCNDATATLTQNGITQKKALGSSLEYSASYVHLVTSNFYGRLYSIAISRGLTVERDFVMAIDAQGKPCLFDKVTREPLYDRRASAPQIIVGLTVAQARKLGNLPADAPTKTLTISLPQSAFVDVETGEIADAAVNVALAQAEAKGWIITKQYFTE